MKKIIVSLVLVVMCVCVAFSLYGCGEDEITYTVEQKEFRFSTDNGATYGNRRYQFEVGQPVSMLLQIKVNAKNGKSENVKKDITCTLVIPQINAIDAYYMKGQKITPENDIINKKTTYTFTLETNTNVAEEFVFKYQPAESGTVQMELTFDDNIPEKYDMINTIEFIKAE